LAHQMAMHGYSELSFFNRWRHRELNVYSISVLGPLVSENQRRTKR
jgi:hypothetical protein